MVFQIISEVIIIDELLNTSNIAIKFHEKDKSYEISGSELYRRIKDKENIAKLATIDKSVIVICLTRSPRIIEYMMASLSVNVPFMYLDPSTPEERRKKILENLGSYVLITEKTSVNERNIDYITTNEYITIICNKTKRPILEDVAYIIYTSGSSGSPKGVMISSENFNRFIESISNRLNFRKGQKIIANTSFSFDISLLESIVALKCGLEVHLTSEFYSKNPHQIVKILKQEKIEVLQLTPTHIRMLHKLYSDKNDFLKEITHLLIGGEAFPVELTEYLCNSSTREVFNLYGPTEATIWSSYKKINSNSPVNIGKPIPGVEIHIMDENGKPLKDGEVGELWISGNTIALGYIDSDLNRNFTSLDSKNCYMTGDIGFIDENHEINWIGRKDNQIKIKGYRVELEEIEKNLLQYSGIHHAKVKFVDECIIAYLVTNIVINKVELNRFLSMNLPKYMLPSQYYKLETVNTNKSGKITINLNEERRNYSEIY